MRCCSEERTGTRIFKMYIHVPVHVKANSLLRIFKKFILYKLFVYHQVTDAGYIFQGVHFGRHFPLEFPNLSGGCDYLNIWGYQSLPGDLYCKYGKVNRQ